MASSPSDEEILNSIAEPYKTKRDVSPSMLYELICNLSVHGIDSDSFTAGPSYGAKIELRNDLNDIEIPFGKNDSVKWKASYIINVNRNAGYGESFASICHELGHLICYHLSMPSTWNEKVWDFRNADLRYTKFIRCNVEGADFRGADMLAAFVVWTDFRTAITDKTTKMPMPTASTKPSYM